MGQGHPKICDRLPRHRTGNGQSTTNHRHPTSWVGTENLVVGLHLSMDIPGATTTTFDRPDITAIPTSHIPADSGSTGAETRKDLHTAQETHHINNTLRLRELWRRGDKPTITRTKLARFLRLVLRTTPAITRRPQENAFYPAPHDDRAGGGSPLPRVSNGKNMVHRWIQKARASWWGDHQRVLPCSISCTSHAGCIPSRNSSMHPGILLSIAKRCAEIGQPRMC